MRIDLLTREYPPEVYGGAGVHAAELVRALRRDIDVRVRCFGAVRDEAGTTAYQTPTEFGDANAALTTMGVDLLIAGDTVGADVVHSHTWYANFAGFTAKRLHGIPHVVTAHSLEPLRPWKAEQLGGGYRLSSWVERTAFEDADAVIAVSAGMRADILRSYPQIDPERVEVVYNGIDLTDWVPNDDPDARAGARRRSRSPLDRVRRAASRDRRGCPTCCARHGCCRPRCSSCSAPARPTPTRSWPRSPALVDVLRTERDGVVWIDRHLPRPELTALLSSATAFVCPSVYEPLGIVNLEAMACGAPVVGTATGGIPEVVDDGVTGVLVPIDQADDGTGTPLDPERFVRDLADALTAVVSDPERARPWGRPGRRRAETHFAGTHRRANHRGLPALLAG